MTRAIPVLLAVLLAASSALAMDVVRRMPPTAVQPACASPDQMKAAAGQIKGLADQINALSQTIASRTNMSNQLAAKRDALAASITPQTPADVAAQRKNDIAAIDAKMAALADANKTSQAQIDADNAKIAQLRAMRPC